MNRLHPYIAAFLLALWWLLRERWDTLPTFAAIETPWYVWAQLACMLAIIGVLCGKQIAAGAGAAWGWVRGRMPQEPGSYLGPFVGLFFGIVLGLGIGFLAAGGFRPSPPSPPKPDVPAPVEPVPSVTRVAIFHESEAGALPPYIGGQDGALGKLRAKGIVTWAGDVDLTNGANAVPAWAKDAVEPAKEVLAADKKAAVLVVFRGNKINVSKAPATVEAFLEAAK